MSQTSPSGSTNPPAEPSSGPSAGRRGTVAGLRVQDEPFVANNPAESVAKVLGVLDVQPEDGAEPDVFTGHTYGPPIGRIFGGQVLAQSLVAATRTVDPDRPVHSLHAYFLRPGDPQVPITFTVERLRDGRSFSARRTQAVQRGEPILSMISSFQTPSPGLDHQSEMPQVPGPEDVPSLEDRFGHLDIPHVQRMLRSRPVDLRHVEGPLYLGPGPEKSPRQNVWMRAAAPLPDDAWVHPAWLAYASDYSLLESIIRAHGVSWGLRGIKSASLDHAMWFHRPARMDEWLLYTQESPSASGARGLGLGRIYTRDGTLVATVAQEGMVRLPEGSLPD